MSLLAKNTLLAGNAPAGVATVAAADSTITVAGTSTAPTVAVGTIVENQVTNLVNDLAAKLVKASNLSDLANVGTARTNLGLAAIAASGSASDLSTGTVATARLGTGTASSSTYLRGDGTWNTPTGSGSGTVTSVTATDGTITVGGTSTDPTIGVGAIAESKVTNLTTDLAAKLVKASNLSDLASASTARTNLGLGGAAVLSVGTSTGTVAAGDDTRIVGALQASANLSDLVSASNARLSLGLGGAAVKEVGTTSGMVAAGDDARFGVVSDGSVTTAKLASAAVTPAKISASQFGPEDHGYLSWSIDPAYANTGQALSAAGVMHVIKVKLPVAATVSAICVQVTIAAVTSVANCFATLYDSSGNRVGVSSNLNTTWTATGYYEHALTSPYSAAAGVYYITLHAGAAGTLPGFSRNSQAVVVNAGLTAPGLRWGTVGTGVTTSPTSITLSSVTASTSATAVSFFAALK